MANNKIVYGNTTLVDLTGDTATIDKVAQGTTFFDASGTQRTGTMTLGGASVSGTHLSIPGKTYTPPSWSTGKAEDIDMALEYHYKGWLNLQDFWHVGDKRTISLSAMAGILDYETHVAQDVEYVLSEIGGKTLVTPINGINKCAFQVDQVNVLQKNGRMYSSNHGTESSWKNSPRRTWCNSTYKSAIDEDVRGFFKEFYNPSGYNTIRSGSGIEQTADYFAFRSEVEILNTHTYSIEGEGEQITYYKTAENRIKNQYRYGNWVASPWWTRSCKNNNVNNWVWIRDAGVIYDYSRTSDYGLAPFSVI